MSAPAAPQPTSASPLTTTGSGWAESGSSTPCWARAAALGLDAVVMHEDNDVSASGVKPRPAYQRLLADLAEGRADAVVVWDLDRLTRRPVEIETFIGLADRHHSHSPASAATSTSAPTTAGCLPG